MRAGWLLGSLLVLMLLGLTGCSPSEGSVKSALEKKSFCRLTDVKLQPPTTHRDGTLQYQGTGTVNCKGSKSYWGAKISEPTFVNIEADMMPMWFGIRHELARYNFSPEKD
ncbi:MAG: hypothetical protein RBU45_09195 [Myxococcota bacterium]|jgi:hypothetical protein|nr:hypothetical protein [Myxococcota bacterium]